MEKVKLDLLKFCAPSEYSISNLDNRVLFFQHYSAYNDPFEFWNYLCEGIPDHETEPERFVAALKAWGVEGGSPKDEDVVAYFDECQHYQPPFKQLRDSTRIACFASQRDNMLMWSHYADGLRGFCIIFDEDSLVATKPEAYVLDVEYRDTPPVVDSFVYAIAHDQEWFNQIAIEETRTRIQYLGKCEEEHWIRDYQQAGEDAVSQMREIWQQVFAVKPLGWKYERERRLLIQTEQYDVQPILRPYPRESVKEVILGERMRDDYRQRIMAVLHKKYPDVPVMTASRVHGCYELAIA